MKRVSRSRHDTLNELNITPLLDLVFVLLVIFIITTPQLVNHLEMTLPSSEARPPAAEETKPEIYRIAVEASGRTLLDGGPVEIPELKRILTQRKAANPELAVVLDGSDDVAYQHMIDVLDVLQQLDIARVGLATIHRTSQQR